MIDADIDFFTMRIGQYEELLKVTPKNFWNEDMFVYELSAYFNRVPSTIKNNIIKMNKATNSRYKYYEDGKAKISKEGIEWLCKNCFKQKYLQLLEEYKMELTETYLLTASYISIKTPHYKDFNVSSVLLPFSLFYIDTYTLLYLKTIVDNKLHEFVHCVIIS